MNRNTSHLLIPFALVLGAGGSVALADGLLAERDPSAGLPALQEPTYTDEDLGYDPPDKQAELATAQDSAEPIPEPTHPLVIQEPFADDGPAEEVAQLKDDVVSGIEEDREIMRATTVPERLREALGRIWAGEALDRVVTETIDAILAADADPNYTNYSGYNFVVEEWQGVRVNGMAGFALVAAHERWYFEDATVKDDATQQFQLEVAKEDGRWKLVHETAVDAEHSEVEGGYDSLP
jgi:hypothetical protein